MTLLVVVVTVTPSISNFRVLFLVFFLRFIFWMSSLVMGRFRSTAAPTTYCSSFSCTKQVYIILEDLTGLRILNPNPRSWLLTLLLTRTKSNNFVNVKFFMCSFQLFFWLKKIQDKCSFSVGTYLARNILFPAQNDLLSLLTADHPVLRAQYRGLPYKRTQNYGTVGLDLDPYIYGNIV